MFNNVKKFVSNPIGTLFPSLGKAQENAYSGFKANIKPSLFGPVGHPLEKAIDQPLQNLQTKLQALPGQIEKMPTKASEFPGFNPEGFLAKNVLPYQFPEVGNKVAKAVGGFGAQVASDITRTVRSVVTPSGREEFMKSLKETPTTYRDKGFLETLNEPAVVTLLTLPDFFTGGGKKEVIESATKRFAKDAAENPSFLRRVVTNIDDAIEPIVNSPLMMKYVRKGRSLLESVPGGTEILNNLDTVFNKGEILMGQTTRRLIPFLKDLTDTEAQVALDVREGLTTTKDPKILKAVDALDSVFKDYAKMAQDAGIEVRDIAGKKKDFIPLKNYIPQRLDIEKLKNNPALQEKLANFLADTGQIPDNVVDGVKQAGTGLVRAQEFVKQLTEGVPVRSAFAELFPNNTLPKRLGNLEFERILNLPKEIDGEQILVRNKQLVADYIARASKRIEQAKVFGPNNEMVNEFQKELTKTGGLPYTKEAVDLVKRELGNDMQSIADIMQQRQLSKIRVFESATKLSTAAISNLFQSINTATSYGIPATTRAIVGDLLHRPESSDFAMNAGIAVEASLRDLAREATGTEGRGIAGKIIAPGFKATEMFNRRVAANAGKIFAVENFNKLLSNADNAEARAALEKFGVDVERALKTGKLSEPDLINAARKAVATTQFTTRISDLPLEWTSSWGKVLTQFKNFSYFQGNFVNDQILKPAMDKNFAPALRYTILSILGGELAADIKAKVRGYERPEDLWKRVGDNFLNASGGLGILSDEWKAIQRGETGIYRWLAGPALGDAVTLVNEMYQAIPKPTGMNLKPLAQDLTYKIPLVGPYLRSKFFPKKSTKKSGIGPYSGSGPASSFSGGLGY